ncbi:hypothetical protein HY500_01695 [Candidatus Woesearchaeota archaeon]|nr:hypothetical protein [Candidatus Woesearchaeota archaeon]
MENIVEKRVEKIKSLLGNFSLSDNKIKFIGLYVVAYLTILLLFQNKFVVGKFYLFVLIPLASLMLIFLGKHIAAILTSIIGFASILRLQPLPNLIDVTTGKYITADPDALAFLRYVKEIVENGALSAVDSLRYYPQGYSNLAEFSFLSHIIAAWYKLVHIFIPSTTPELIHTTYPAFSFIIAMIFFFLFARRISNTKVAVIATAILSVIPTFLFRTLTGVSDKEALGLAFMFGAFYLYTVAFQSNSIKKSAVFAVLAGLSTGILGLIWGGVSFIFLIFGIFSAVNIIADSFTKKDFYTYSIWMFASMITLSSFYPERFTLNAYLTSITTMIMLAAFFFSLIHFIVIHLKLFGIYERFKDKSPDWVISGIITVIFSVIFFSLLYGPAFLISRVTELTNSLLKPFAQSRWAITVAESHQPFFKGGSLSWFAEFNNNRYVIFLFFIGIISVFYKLAKDLGKNKILGTALFTIFIFGVVLSRYSPDSKFNGESLISQITYFGSIAGLFIMLGISSYFWFKKDRDMFEKLKNIKKEYFFIIIWFVIMAVGARSAIRLFIVFAPVVSFLIAYFIVNISEYILELAKSQKDKLYKISLIAVLILITMSLFWPFGSLVSAVPVAKSIPIINHDGLIFQFASASLSVARGTGSVYDQQWQLAGKWVRDNLPKDAVFAHWWDYGYLVQTGFERATLTDGGNAIGSRNFFSGRHLMTAQNETEALEYMKTYGATHVLFVVDEIGKYPAYSSIGSDANYDRFSQITTFGLDQQSTRETRNATVLVYKGGAPLEDDLNFNGEIYPAGASGIGAVLVPVTSAGVEGYQSISQPLAILVYQGKQVEVPISCIYIDKIYNFENAPLKSCLRVMPTFKDGQLENGIGNALYLSPRVAQGLFARLYLLNEQMEGFKLAYSDESSVPLAFYNGRLIGPLKIWESKYDEKIKTVPEYLRPELPDPSVNIVRK